MKEITNWENANEEVLTNEEQEEKEAVLIDSVDEKTDDVFAKLLAEIADEKSDANDESNDSNESNEDSDEYEDDNDEDDSDEDSVVASDESEEKPKKGLSRGQNIALIAISAILALLLRNYLQRLFNCTTFIYFLLSFFAFNPLGLIIISFDITYDISKKL